MRKVSEMSRSFMDDAFAAHRPDGTADIVFRHPAVFYPGAAAIHHESPLASVHYRHNQLFSIDMDSNFVVGDYRSFVSPDIQIVFRKNNGRNRVSLVTKPDRLGIDFDQEKKKGEVIFSGLWGDPHMRLIRGVKNGQGFGILEHIPSGVQKVVSAPVELKGEAVGNTSAHELGVKAEYRGPVGGLVVALAEAVPHSPERLLPDMVGMHGPFASWLLGQAAELDGYEIYSDRSKRDQKVQALREQFRAERTSLRVPPLAPVARTVYTAS